MKPTVYLETTIASLLTAWPGRAVAIAGQPIATRDWWAKRRADFELYVSPEVLGEAAQGDAVAARMRLIHPLRMRPELVESIFAKEKNSPAGAVFRVRARLRVSAPAFSPE